jgi:hypothetical protein
MPLTDAATVRAWCARNFTTKGAALGKGWIP